MVSIGTEIGIQVRDLSIVCSPISRPLTQMSSSNTIQVWVTPRKSAVSLSLFL